MRRTFARFVPVTRKQRIIALATAAGMALAALALAVALGSASKKPAATTITSGRSFLAGVEQHGDTLGRPDAPATLLVFEDPQCPYCRTWSVDTLPSVVDGFVRTGRVKLVWRGIPIVGEDSVAGLRGAYAAAQQNRLWSFVDQLFQRQGTENSGWITVQLLGQAADTAGVTASTMLAAAGSAAVTARLKLAIREATKYGVHGTPTFVLLRRLAPPQQLELRSLDSASFDSVLSAALR